MVAQAQLLDQRVLTLGSIETLIDPEASPLELSRIVVVNTAEENTIATVRLYLSPDGSAFTSSHIFMIKQIPFADYWDVQTPSENAAISVPRGGIFGAELLFGTANIATFGAGAER